MDVGHPMFTNIDPIGSRQLPAIYIKLVNPYKISFFLTHNQNLMVSMVMGLIIHSQATKNSSRRA